MEIGCVSYQHNDLKVIAMDCDEIHIKNKTLTIRFEKGEKVVDLNDVKKITFRYKPARK